MVNILNPRIGDQIGFKTAPNGPSIFGVVERRTADGFVVRVGLALRDIRANQISRIGPRSRSK